MELQSGNSVFADTLYWIARARPGDPWHRIAVEVREILGEIYIITTDEVLTEFLNALSALKYTRSQALKMVRAIMKNPNIRVIPQTRESFLSGLDLFEQRADKKYSLTDCISMNVMRAESLTRVLTNDHHFEQEGFTVLMKRDG